MMGQPGRGGRETPWVITALGEAGGPQNATCLALCRTTPALTPMCLSCCIGLLELRLHASGGQAGGALTPLLPGVRATTHHGSSLLSVSPQPGTVLGPLLLVL